MDRETETVLLRGIKYGDIQLFERFVLEYQKPLYAFILNIVKNEDDARDLCQEAFFKAYKSLRSFKGEAKFSTWLFQIGYFQALNFMKKRKRGKEILRILSTGIKKRKPDQDLEVQEMNKKVEEIIQGIHFKHRTALFLFYKEEKSYREIAVIMKAPLNSVKSYLFRGKEEIRKRMERDFQMKFQANEEMKQ